MVYIEKEKNRWYTLIYKRFYRFNNGRWEKMMKKCFFKILFITTILWISCFFYSCGNNIEGEWYTIGFSSSDANSYEVKKSIDITGEHFVIDGKAYAYILDENYIVVSNDRTYTLEDDDKYGEVLIYNNDIVAFRDKDKAELRVEEKKTETPDSDYDDVDQLIEDLQ